MIAYAEKRDYLRMAIDCSFRFTVVDDHRQHQGKVINLSSRGILFTSKQRLETGTLLDIVLAPSHPTTPPMHAKAEVARVTGNRLFYEVACRIKKIPA
jgi:hypothetical protein